MILHDFAAKQQELHVRQPLRYEVCASAQLDCNEQDAIEWLLLLSFH
jgi:hypothetical protein